MTAYDHAALLILGLVARRNPIQPGVIAADLGTTNGTPMVLLDGGGARRRAAYLAPHAIRIGGAIFWERGGPALDAPPVVPLTTYQTPYVPHRYGGSTGSRLGVASDGVAATTPSTDWAADAVSTTRRRGARLPLILGRAGHVG